jgi:choline dehydrogenase-like flavoprotein
MPNDSAAALDTSPPFEVTAEAASSTAYDAVIVGSGVSGAILARELSRAGYRILLMEAGPGRDLTVRDYERNLERFYGAVSKDNNAPYAENRNAPMPRSYETQKLRPGQPDTSGYFVQKGPWEIDSTYTRVLGGTTRHWEGKALRMLPDDFVLRRKFGQGLDWPLSYDELRQWYPRAELELGVSGDVEDQGYGGLEFGDGYVFPMHKMPLSYLDQLIARDVDGTEVTLGEERFTLRIRSTPQARNGVPNPAYDGGRGHRPDGAVSLHQAEMGERCQGNTNCVPICPVQAKYDARRTLYQALQSGRVDLLTQAVASRVQVDSATGRVTGIEFQRYHDSESREHVTGTARGTVFILAANAVENARLMLASGLHSTSGLVGRNLMDHAYLLTWALMPEVAGAYRGPLCTSGIEDLRTGTFRRNQAAYRAGIHNDGWGWATASPYTDLDVLIDLQNKFGRGLREALVSRLSRQVLIDYMVEMLPEPSNRVTVDPQYTDQLGNPRPVIAFGISDYTMEGVASARQVARRIYQRMGAEEYTNYDPGAVGYVSYEGESYVIRGGNHWAGTHVMGTSASNSVVDDRQRSWDHPNLYLTGAGSMPTIGTANTTLTLSALCFRTAEQIARELGRGNEADVRRAG